MRVTFVAIVLFALSGCGSNRLHGAESELRASANALRWERAFVGYPVDRTLRLDNTGRVDRSVRLGVAEPFSVDADQIDVAAGAQVEVVIHFAPTQEGHSTGTLTLTSDGDRLSIVLEAEGLAPPVCADAAACHAITFDPSAGECLTTILPNDTACSTPCVEAGECHGGVCLGGAGTCDDANACTQDACDPISGCVHVDLSSSCTAPDEACRVPYCDPVSGCGVANAQDGTPCGAADCVTADVCLAGVCTTVSVLEGATCAPDRPCQQPGVCHQQICVRPPPAPMQPMWTHTVGGGDSLYFPGVADPQGNLYWAECGALDCRLVSFTRDGFQRYAVPLSGHLDGDLLRPVGSMVLVGSSIAVATRDTVQLFRAADGVELWARNLRSELIPQAAPTDAYLTMGPILDLGIGRVAVRAARTDPNGLSGQSWMVALSEKTGATDWSWEAGGILYEDIVADANGATWAYDLGSSPPQLVKLSADGGLASMQTQSVFPQPVATYGERLILSGGSLLSTIDGSLLSQLWNPGDQMSPLIGDAVGYFAGVDYRDGTPLPGSFVRRFDPEDGTVIWSARVTDFGIPSSEPSAASLPLLLADDSVLLAKGERGGPWQLVDLTPEGTEGYSCDLPGQESYAAVPTVLANGRWTIADESRIVGGVPVWTIKSFDAGKARLAPTGWTMFGGGPEGSGRPR